MKVGRGIKLRRDAGNGRRVITTHILHGAAKPTRNAEPNRPVYSTKTPGTSGVPKPAERLPPFLAARKFLLRKPEERQ